MASPRSRKVSWVAACLWLAVLTVLWFGSCRMAGEWNSRLYGAAGQLFGCWQGVPEPQLVPYGETVQTKEVQVTERSRECPLVGMVALNSASAEAAFAALPLGPQDMAVLLNKLAQSKVETVGLSASFMWKDGVGDMGKELLCHVLEGFPHAAVGLRGRTAAQADFTPMMLRDAAIPADNIEGDPSKLPMANKPLPNGLTDAPDSLTVTWAPDWLQDEPITQKPSAVENVSFPLLVRWNGEAIPTLPFRLALAHLGLSPADVKVSIGHHIRYGGFELPLDEYGRTRLTDAHVAMLPLEDVVADGAAKQDIKLIMLEQPQEEKGETLRLERLARTLSQMAGKEKITVHTEQRPVGDVALTAAWRTFNWQTAAMVLAGLLLALRYLPNLPVPLLWLLPLAALLRYLWMAYDLLLQEGQWLPLPSLLLGWAVLTLALRRLKPVKPAPGRRI